MKSFLRCFISYVLLQTIIFIWYETLYLDSEGFITTRVPVFPMLCMYAIPIIGALVIGAVVFKLSLKGVSYKKNSFSIAMKSFVKNNLLIIVVILAFWVISTKEGYIWKLFDAIVNPPELFTAVQRYIGTIFIDNWSLLGFICMYVSYKFSKAFFDIKSETGNEVETKISLSE